MADEKRARLLVFVVAYHAEKTIEKVLTRIPQSLSADYEVEILAIDDASRDRTFEVGSSLKRLGSLAFPFHVFVNPENQGYGGNQKLGYQYALSRNFDFVALIHGDGQYAPELLPSLLEPLRDGSADAVFGSRMLSAGAARRGGMPFYKLIGNKILTRAENALLRTQLSEFHSGYRIYSSAALRKIPFDRNTNDFHFDTEIIVQLVFAKQRIRELPIPTYYGDEICRVNGLTYALNVVIAVMKARAQQMGLLYDRKFDCQPAPEVNAHYGLKLGYESTHEAALSIIAPGSRVLDVGCAGGYWGGLLRTQRGCRVVGIDAYPIAQGVELDGFIQHDLEKGLPEVDLHDFDCVLMLDVIEHLGSPEAFIETLHVAMSGKGGQLIISTGNVGFVIVRLMLLLGQFNYGKRGILDVTHKRLLTFASLRRLLEQGGFRIVSVRGIAAPFPLALGEGRLGRVAVAVNRFLIGLWKALFSYQILMVAEPRPTVECLLERAIQESERRNSS